MSTIRFFASAIILAALIHVVQGHTLTEMSHGFFYSVGVCVSVFSVLYLFFICVDWVLSEVEAFRIDERNNHARELVFKFNQQHTLSAEEQRTFEQYLRDGVVERMSISRMMSSGQAIQGMFYQMSLRANQIPRRK